MEQIIHEILVPAGILGTILGALVGLPFGIIARARAKHYSGEAARFLRLLGHHILEPMITIGSALLAVLFRSYGIEALSGFQFPLMLVTLFSFLGMFSPFFSHKWETPWLRRYNNQLRGWVLARFFTFIFTWCTGLYLGADSTPKEFAILAVCVYFAGVLVMWASIMRGALMIRAFPKLSPEPSMRLPSPELS